jgi:hypothetical protein
LERERGAGARLGARRHLRLLVKNGSNAVLLAPIEMAWEGKSVGDICQQVKDRDRNGGRDLALLQAHVAKDDLIAWGWNPGAGRDPAPGTQDLAGQLIQAWIDTGAQCP